MDILFELLHAPFPPAKRAVPARHRISYRLVWWGVILLGMIGLLMWQPPVPAPWAPESVKHVLENDARDSNLKIQ